MTRNRVSKSAINPDVFAIASETELGLIRVGDNLTIEADGTLHAEGGAIPDATLTGKGVVQLSSETNSTSEILAATPHAVKKALDASVKTSEKGVANGIATLGSDGKLTPAQRPDAQDPTNYDGNATRQNIFVGPGQQFTTIQAALNSLKKFNAGEKDLILTAGHTFTENVTIKGFHGGRIIVRGNGNVNLNGSLEVEDCTADVTLQYITIGTSSAMVSIQNTGYVYLSNIKKTVSGSTGMWLGKGRFYLSFCTFSNQTYEAIAIFSNAYAQMTTVTGTGNSVALTVRESIVFKDTASTITGTTALSKSNGGQVFT